MKQRLAITCSAVLVVLCSVAACSAPDIAAPTRDADTSERAGAAGSTKDPALTPGKNYRDYYEEFPSYWPDLSKSASRSRPGDRFFEPGFIPGVTPRTGPMGGSGA
jgi:hypothetical protein